MGPEEVLQEFIDDFNSEIVEHRESLEEMVESGTDEEREEAILSFDVNDVLQQINVGEDLTGEQCGQ